MPDYRYNLTAYSHDHVIQRIDELPPLTTPEQALEEARQLSLIYDGTVYVGRRNAPERPEPKPRKWHRFSIWQSYRNGELNVRDGGPKPCCLQGPDYILP